MLLGAVVVAGCVDDTNDQLGTIDQAVSNPIDMSSRAKVHAATLHANHGGYAWARAGTYYDGRGETRSADAGSTDNSGRVSWKVGPWTETWEGELPSGQPYHQVTTCTYGWCGPGSDLAGTRNGCIPSDNSESGWGYSYGACNSSAWGQRFAGYLEDVDRPAGSGDKVHADYAAGASGTTTFGYHPYWAVTYNGECRIYQGWSYTVHNCFDDYVLNAPSVCGDGFCDDSDESCLDCTADCGSCPATCGNNTCDWYEDCSTCENDCGNCAQLPPPPCSTTYSTSSTSNASYTSGNTRKLDVFLRAGVEYTFSTCSSGSGDSYLRLHLNGSQVAANDDACGSRSRITYTPSTTGTFVLSMGCYGSGSCSGPVTITPGDDGQCTGVYNPGGGGGGGGGGCVPDCDEGLCGQDDGCGGVCSDAEANECGQCGNPGPSCTGDMCGQDDGCGGTCPTTDASTCGKCGNPACSGLTVPNISGSSGSSQYWSYTGTNVVVQLSGGSGDADLYVRLGAQPSRYTYDCRSAGGSNNEVCTMTGSGTFQVLVYGYNSYSGATLTITNGN